MFVEENDEGWGVGRMLIDYSSALEHCAVCYWNSSLCHGQTVNSARSKLRVFVSSSQRWKTN